MKQMSDKEKAYFIALLFPFFWPLALAMFICDVGDAIWNAIKAAAGKRRRAIDPQSGKDSGDDRACQCCGTAAPLRCGPSRFGPETWACEACWNPAEGPALSSTQFESGK